MWSAAEANRRYFQRAYRTGEHGWAVEDPCPYAVGYLKQLNRVAPGGELLDVGCGEGRHSFAAARLGFKVTAVDYEPLALKCARRLAKAKHIARVVFRKADVFCLPFSDSRFDIILDYGCLHHQRKTDWPRYRASILRVLKPRGHYVLSVFSPKFRLFLGSRRSWHVAYGAYRRCFTAKEIEGLFTRDFDLLEMVEEREKDRGFWHVLMKRLTEAEQRIS